MGFISQLITGGAPPCMYLALGEHESCVHIISYEKSLVKIWLMMVKIWLMVVKIMVNDG